MNTAMLTLGILALVGTAAGLVRVAPMVPRSAAETLKDPARTNPDDAAFLALLDASGEGFSATIAPGQAVNGARPTLMLVPHRVHRTLHNELVGVRSARARSNDPLVDFMGILGPWPVLDGEGKPIPAYIDRDGNSDPAGQPNPDAMAIGWYSNPIARLVIRKSLLILRGVRPTGGMELGAGEASPGQDGDGDTPLFQGVSGKVDGTTDTIVTLFIELLPPIKDGGGNVTKRSAILYAYSADTNGGHARIVFRGMALGDITFDEGAWTEPSVSAGSYNRPAAGIGYVVMESVDGVNSACFHFWPELSGNTPAGQLVIVSWDAASSPAYSVGVPKNWAADTNAQQFVDYCKKLMTGAEIPTP